jgi:hypothetical protein
MADLPGATIQIHGADWELAYVRDSVRDARAFTWRPAECLAVLPEHGHCLICWWELHASAGESHRDGYRNDDAWLCKECFGGFIEGDELILGTV